jgi:pimeloyl-ACP methyl ester carboxylesterase
MHWSKLGQTPASGRANMADAEDPTKPEPFEVATGDDILIRGEVSGPRAGPPAILLHGGGQSRSAWRGAARRLAEAGYRAAAMDLRGHGDSDWSPGKHYSFDDYAYDLARTIDALGAPAVLVGASLGGHVSVVMAARHPDKVRALALADVTPWIDEGEIGSVMRAAMRRMGQGVASLEEAAQLVADLRGGEPRRDLSGLAYHLRKAADGRWYWKWDPAYLAEANLRHGGEDGLFVAAARRLRCPVLVMRAEFSTVTTADQVELFRAAVPWLQDVVIPGAGHMLTGDVNDVYATHVLRFLSTSEGVNE